MKSAPPLLSLPSEKHCPFQGLIFDSFATPWTVVHQAPLSMGFPRQDYRSGLSFPSPGHLPYPGIQPLSPALAGRFFITEPPGKPTQDATSGKLPHIFVRSQDDDQLGEGGWGNVQKGHEGAFLGDVPHLLGGGRQRCSLCANLSIFSIKSSDSIIFRQVAYYLISGST